MQIWKCYQPTNQLTGLGDAYESKKINFNKINLLCLQQDHSSGRSHCCCRQSWRRLQLCSKPDLSHVYMLQGWIKSRSPVLFSFRQFQICLDKYSPLICWSYSYQNEIETCTPTSIAMGTRSPSSPELHILVAVEEYEWILKSTTLPLVSPSCRPWYNM